MKVILCTVFVLSLFLLRVNEPCVSICHYILYFNLYQGTNILELRVKRMYYKADVCSFYMLLNPI